MAEQAVERARRVVDELHTTINSALRVLDDAELDSTKARLSDRGDYYLEAAGEHLSRLQRRCSDNADLVDNSPDTWSMHRRQSPMPTISSKTPTPSILSSPARSRS
jgi:hypothetical protein